MNYLISALIFFTSTAYISGRSFASVQTDAFKIGTILIWLVSLNLKPQRQVVNVWFNVLVGLAFVQTLLLRNEPLNIALNVLQLVFLATILYYTLSNYLSSIKPIIDGISWVVVAQATIVLLQVTGYDPICLNDSGKHNTHMVGLYGLKYLLGSWTAMACPILIFNKRKISGIIAGILCLCSMSWASVGIMIIVLVTATFFISRRLAIVLLVSTLLMSSAIYIGYFHPKAYYTQENTGGGGVNILDENGNKTYRTELHPTSLQYKIKSRITLQSKFLPMLFTKPLTGFGLGSFKYLGPSVNTFPYGTMRDAWNDYLEQGIQLGLGFIIIFLLLCRDIWRRFKNAVKDMPLIGIFASLLTIPLGMLFHDILNHSSMNILIISILSAFTIRSKQYEAKSL